MVENQGELEIAEKYLAEMPDADRDGDYLAFIKHFEPVDSEEFNENAFLRDVESMRQDLGEYKERVYLGSLDCSCEEGKQRSLRFVWRGIYDKNEALIVLGIHQIDGIWYMVYGIWYVNENHIS